MRFFIVYIIASIFTVSVVAQTSTAVVLNDSLKYNSYRGWMPVKPEKNPNQLQATVEPQVAFMQTRYFDELARSVQVVSKKASLITNPSNPVSAAEAVDLIEAQQYDALGRTAYEFLPTRSVTTGITGNLNDGSFKRDPYAQLELLYNSGDSVINPLFNQGESHFYKYNVYNNTSFNKVIEQFAPGKNWAGTKDSISEDARRSVKLKDLTNVAIDAVRVWNVNEADTGWATYVSPTVYVPGTLHKTISTDEMGNQVVQFFDKGGLLILKKVQISSIDRGTGSGHTGWACTYYVYDDARMLRAIIQPLAVGSMQQAAVLTEDHLKEQVFRYEYDEFGRLIRKKVPGAEPEYFVYDSRDRLVMSQDGFLRKQHPDLWSVYLYDALNREVENGLYQFPASLSQYEHIQAAGIATGSYPFTSTPSAGWTSLLRYGYDRYTTLPVISGLNADLDNSFNSYLLAESSTVYPYPQTPVKKNAIKGLVAWKQVRILNSNNWLTEVYIYDEDGNIIQVKRVNEFGGIDIVTTQYSWSGQLLVNVFKSSKDGDIANQTIWITRNTLDELGRVVKVEKQFVTNLAGVSKKNVNRTIAQYQYDALGNVREKKLGTDPSNTANALETQVFDYNVRGWLLGMNRNELRVNNNQTGSYFAFDLGYDKLINISGRNYSNTQYNGNVAGMIWESKGDGIRRKYDFTYDRANRFLRAGYIQNDAGSTWGTTKMSFSMYMGGTSSATGPQAYDLNGNILRVLTNGYVLGSTSIQQIDHLNYNYETGTNRLLKVTDTASSSGNGKLGDFLQGEHTGDDYAYDEMGNLTMDKNKGVDSILYNHLHKVSRIVMKNNQGTIDYEYDAAGNKLKKITRVNNVEKDSLTTDITTTTYYYGNEIYVTMAYSNATLQNKYGVSDELQLILFEEGRIRLVKSAVTDSSDFQFDYFLKDHLGNVRSVITEEVRTDYYIAASMEDAAAALENVFYTNLDETRVDKPAGYPSTPGTKVAKVGGSTSQPSVGPGKLLRVMAGDKVSMAVTSWWSGGVTPVNTANVAAPLLDLLSMAIPAGSGGKIAQASVPGTVLSPAIASFLNARNPNTPAKPKAFLNWVLFDEQLNYVADGSNAQVVGADGVLTLLSRTNMPISKNGYLYVYVSNVSENIAVYFDDLQVTHERGALLEETHYYPFGLVMHGISSKAFGSLQNSYKFNGGSELNEDFGLQWYETGARLYDPQLGRFLQIDGLANLYSDWSCYVFGLNNPIRFIDPSGLAPEDPDKKSDDCLTSNCLPLATVYGKLPNSRDSEEENDDNIAGWIWRPFYKKDLFAYALSRGYRNPSNNDLGEIFERAFANKVASSFGSIRRGFKYEDFSERNTIPDFVGDAVVYIVEGGKVRSIAINNAIIFELKAKYGGLYLSSNIRQIEGHINNIAASFSAEMSKYKAQGFRPLVTLITTADVNFSPTIASYARLRNVAYVHYHAEYRVVNGQWEFRFTKPAR